ncbi:MAG: hypothetical protein FJ087_17190, partial [Deltaproteobacteria bacterium]|nr:hypothetical protein [Deltaproteobacteria bacterium]
IEASGAAAAYEGVASAVLDQADVHALMLVFVWIPESRFDAAAVAERLARRHPGKPFVAVFMGGPPDEVREVANGLEARGVPCYPDVSRAMRAVAALARRGTGTGG